MTKKTGLWMRGALAVAASGFAVGCGGDAQADAATEASTATQQGYTRVVNVRVEEVTPRAFEEQIQLTGTVLANQDVEVSAQESGIIREVLVEKGSAVEEGQPLFRIDDSVLQAQVAQARAQSELAAQTWERRKRLWEEDQVGSELAYLEAKFAAEQSAANLAALEERLARTTIRAPFAGVMEQRLVEVGTMVSPGQVVARVVDLNPVKVVAGVPERYAADVQVGSQGVVLFDVLPGERYTARVGYVGSTVDPQNRTFSIEIEMPNPGGLIKPQMVANVAVERRSLSEALVVPQDAVVRVEDGYVVYVAESGEAGTIASARPVSLGPSQRNQVVVESGLEAGDRLIVVGQRSLANGDRINVVDG